MKTLERDLKDDKGCLLFSDEMICNERNKDIAIHRERRGTTRWKTETI
jgi:hypothetical protein